MDVIFVNLILKFSGDIMFKPGSTTSFAKIVIFYKLIVQIRKKCDALSLLLETVLLLDRCLWPVFGSTDARIQIRILSQMKNVVAKAVTLFKIHRYINHYLLAHEAAEILLTPKKRHCWNQEQVLKLQPEQRLLCSTFESGGTVQRTVSPTRESKGYLKSKKNQLVYLKKEDKIMSK